MKVTGFIFMGVRTSKFEEMRKFYEEVMGLEVTKNEPGAAWFKLPNQEEIHVYGADDADHHFFGPSPVVGFLVDDFEEAYARMQAAGIQFIGDPQRTDEATWNHFYGPDGNVYEIMEVVSRKAPQR